MSRLTFNNKNKEFYTDLKQAVDNYFAVNKIKKTGNIHLYLKTLVLIPGAVAIYVLLLSGIVPAAVGLILCAVLGFVLASIGFNVMHDACHGSYSSKKWVNEFFGYSLNALGGNAFIWKFKHNILHHTYTNVDGLDDDIAKSPLMRQCSSQKWVPAHRFQHIYVVLVYAISSFAWTTLMDFNKYFKQKIHNTPLQKMNFKEHFIFWFSKVLYVTFYVVIPIVMVGAMPWLIGFTVMHIVMGFTLAIVFQLAHVVEETEFVHIGKDDIQIENEWAVHQVKSTANFAPHNKVISWFVGGLNFQIEHHLFPRISHIHYPGISKIVSQKCKEHNLVYHVNDTMDKAIISHFKMMKELGKPPVALSGLVS